MAAVRATPLGPLTSLQHFVETQHVCILINRFCFRAMNTDNCCKFPTNVTSTTAFLLERRGSPRWCLHMIATAFRLHSCRQAGFIADVCVGRQQGFAIDSACCRSRFPGWGFHIYVQGFHSFPHLANLSPSPPPFSSCSTMSWPY